MDREKREKRIDERIDDYRIKIKDSEDLKVRSEVFDTRRSRRFILSPIRASSRPWAASYLRERKQTSFTP